MQAAQLRRFLARVQIESKSIHKETDSNRAPTLSITAGDVVARFVYYGKKPVRQQRPVDATRHCVYHRPFVFPSLHSSYLCCETRQLCSTLNLAALSVVNRDRDRVISR